MFSEFNKPDVIILDYHLDGIDKNAMNGFETLDKIKEFKYTSCYAVFSR
jgi:CheY-like chemotaxis protein